jgi:hypothetical protein
MLLQSLRALCFAPGGPGSIWNYLGAPVRSTGVSGRFGCSFRTDVHFADVAGHRFSLRAETGIQILSRRALLMGIGS